MDSSRKSNKIRDIVRLQQILKKWKKLANNNTNISTENNSRINRSVSSKSINKFLKKTLNFSDISSSLSLQPNVPKGYIAVCVGKELKRFVIPTEYLSHKAFEILLREAEEEFGFQQEGVLKFPCEVECFENILKMIQYKKLSATTATEGDVFFYHNQLALIVDDAMASNGHPQMCR